MAEAVARAEAELGPLRLALNVAGRLDRQHCLNVGRDRQPRADAGALQRLRGRRDPHAQIDGDGLGGSRDQGQFDLAGLYRDADEHAAGDGCCGVQRVTAQKKPPNGETGGGQVLISEETREKVRIVYLILRHGNSVKFASLRCSFCSTRTGQTQTKDGQIAALVQHLPSTSPVRPVLVTGVVFPAATSDAPPPWAILRR